jgi:hypothetical protein
VTPSPRSAVPVVTPRSSPAPTGGGDTKRQKTQAAPPAGKKTQGVSPDPDRKKSLGALNFDPAVAGTTRLPQVNVYHRNRNAKNPERLCMKFLTRGYVCDRPDCKLPHVSNLDDLTAAERTKLTEFVRKQPGLTWAEGKAPAGTS